MSCSKIGSMKLQTLIRNVRSIPAHVHLSSRGSETLGITVMRIKYGHELSITDNIQKGHNEYLLSRCAR